MGYQVTITDITGTTPFNIYVCDNPITSCVYINTITSGDLPNYVFNVPDVMTSMSSYTLKIIDNVGCVSTEVLTP
jgi:hypothetical protein